MIGIWSMQLMGYDLEKDPQDDRKKNGYLETKYLNIIAKLEIDLHINGSVNK